MRHKIKEKLLRRISPPVNPSQNSQSKSRNPTSSKNTSSNKKNNSITLEVSNKTTPPYTLALPAKSDAIDYNIVEDLKRARDNISIFELAKIVGQLVQAFSQPSSGDKASTSQKVFGKSYKALEFVVNVVTLDVNNICAPIFANV